MRRGEEGIAILAPLVRRARHDPDDTDLAGDPDDTHRCVVYGWRIVYVFDFAQTEGPPIAAYTPPTTTGDVGPHLRRLVDFVHGLGITLRFVDDLGGDLGRCRPGASIDILDSLTPPSKFAVLVHETAHDLLHRRDDPARPRSRTGRETEAEAVAGIVTQAIGLDHRNTLTNAHRWARA